LITDSPNMSIVGAIVLPKMACPAYPAKMAGFLAG
jgi:hypothetical protein